GPCCWPPRSCATAGARPMRGSRPPWPAWARGRARRCCCAWSRAWPNPRPPRCSASPGPPTAWRCSGRCRGWRTAAPTPKPGARCRPPPARPCARCPTSAWPGSGPCATAPVRRPPGSRAPPPRPCVRAGCGRRPLWWCSRPPWRWRPPGGRRGGRCRRRFRPAPSTASRCPPPPRRRRGSIRPTPWPATATWTCCWPRSPAGSTRTPTPPSMPGWSTRWPGRPRAATTPVRPPRRPKTPRKVRMRRPELSRIVAAGMLLAAAGAALADGAARIAALDPAQRAALQRRPADWDALPADERERMRAAREAGHQLRVDRQQSLRAPFDALYAGIRGAWLLGPALGAHWPRLHAPFAQVSPDEREALLSALRALGPQALEDLGVLAQRTPPQERAALREALLAQPPGERAAWLRARLAP